MNQAFRDEIRAKRVKMHLTQQDVANALGITRRAYISFEQGQQNYFRKKETLIKLCEFLDVKVPLEEKDEPLKFKPKMTCEISPDTQLYKGLMLAGFAEPGDKITIVIERGDS